MRKGAGEGNNAWGIVFMFDLTNITRSTYFYLDSLIDEIVNIVANILKINFKLLKASYDI